MAYLEALPDPLDRKSEEVGRVSDRAEIATVGGGSEAAPYGCVNTA